MNFPKNTKQANEDLVKQVYNTQTRYRGSDDQEYQIYVAAAESLGWKVKTYEEWKSS